MKTGDASQLKNWPHRTKVSGESMVMDEENKSNQIN